MRRPLRLLLALLICCGALPPTVPWAQQITVGPNVHVSEAHADRPHYELHLSADSEDPSLLVGGSMVWIAEDNKYQVAAYRSSDQGQTWRPSAMVEMSGPVMDPAFAHGPGDLAYMTLFGVNADGGTEARFYRSADEGDSWAEPQEVNTMDRPYITVDHTQGDSRGRIYINGVNGVGKIDGGSIPGGVGLLRSTDGGRSFEGPFAYVPSGDRYVLGMGNGVIQSDGTYVVLFGEREALGDIESGEPIPEEANAQLKVMTSSNGGDSFKDAAVVADWYQRFGVETTIMPYLAVDPSEGPFQDRLYAVWTDYRHGRAEVLLSHSLEGSGTWSDPVVVDDDTGSDFQPVVAVNEEGVVGVMWYDRHDEGLGWDVHFGASWDGGTTFPKKVRISEASFDYDLSKGLVIWGLSSQTPTGAKNVRMNLHHFNDKGGDTAGMAADAEGVFHPFWIDNRTGVPQVWTAQVTTSGQARRFGDAQLADLNDVSERVAFTFSSPQFDEESQTGSVSVSLRNTSEASVRTPLKARVTALDSQFGRPAIVGAANGKSGVGAVIDFSDAVDGGVLAPGAATAPHKLEYRLDGFEGVEQSQRLVPEWGGYSFLNMDMVVLGKVAE